MARYTINLSEDERKDLLHMIKTGKDAAYKLSHAPQQISSLLLTMQGLNLVNFIQ